MANTRLTCVVRRGLELPEGLLAAQVAHISDQWMRTRILEGEQFTAEEKEWMATPYISVLAVNTLEELKAIHDDSVAVGLKTEKWHDIIHSKILQKDIPDIWVGISIGPSDFDLIRAITGNLTFY